MTSFIPQDACGFLQQILILQVRLDTRIELTYEAADTSATSFRARVNPT
jgi:hypothetical protein